MTVQTFLLPGIMAFGATSSQRYPIDSSGIEEYLNSIRTYEKIEIQPLLIQTEVPLEHGWNYSPYDGYSLVASHWGIYEIRLRDPVLRASDVLDVLHGTLAFMHSVSSEELILIPVEEKNIPSSRIIDLNEAVRLYSSALPYTSEFYRYEHIFLNSWCRGSEFDASLWPLIAHVIGDEEVVYALMFLRAASENYLFLGDEIENVIIRSEEVPSRIVEAVDVENAIHNTYKVVEAIYSGVLSSNWNHVAGRLATKGIDARELVGYRNHGIFEREPVLDKIKKLKQARDDRAAHGRIHENRRNTYYELMDFQELARHLFDRYIHMKYPQIKATV